MPLPIPGKGGKINPNSAHVKKYEKLLQETHDAALQSVGASPDNKINEFTYALNGFSALLTPAQAEEMTKQVGVVLVQPDEMRYRQTDSSPTFLGLNAPPAPGRLGTPVKVWLLASSTTASGRSTPALPTTAATLSCKLTQVCPVNLAIRTTIRTTCLLSAITSYSALARCSATYRTLIGADPDEFDSARDDNGHGTHTASTAAGNYGVEASIYGVSRGVVSGVAPRARVIAYKGLGNLGGFGSDLAAAIDQAVADGVDVINYSIGLRVLRHWSG